MLSAMLREKEPILSRRDFLKLAGTAIITYGLRPDEWFTEESLSGSELEQRVPATKIPVIEYHYPGFSEAGVQMPKDLLIAQLDYLQEGNFKTLTDTELAGFLDYSAVFPAKSVALRIDQGAAHFSEFASMIDEVRKRGFHAMVFVTTGEQFTQDNWDRLTGWVGEGVISFSPDSRINEAKSPRLYPYVAGSTLEILAANARNNPRSIPLIGGYTFEKLVSLNLTPVTVQTIESITDDQYPEYVFAKCRYLPTSQEQAEHLTKPEGIVIHTDDQSGTDWLNWDTKRTYNGLFDRGIDTHFAVGRNGVDQYLKMYKDVATPTRGAVGFSNYISIEMCGRDYNDIFDASADVEKRKAIEEITMKTVRLAVWLMDTYQIGLNTILGHYAATASGKTDPGQKYMEEYFMSLLRSAYSAKHGARVSY